MSAMQSQIKLLQAGKKGFELSKMDADDMRMQLALDA